EGAAAAAPRPAARATGGRARGVAAGHPHPQPRPHQLSHLRPLHALCGYFGARRVLTRRRPSMKMHRSTAFPSFLARSFALVAMLIAGAALAQQQAAPAAADPPARVGTLTAVEGSVVFAPAGETEWAEVPRNRPITRGDRLRTDEGARAELHFGSAALQMDSRTFVEVVAVDED